MNSVKFRCVFVDHEIYKYEGFELITRDHTGDGKRSFRIQTVKDTPLN